MHQLRVRANEGHGNPATVLSLTHGITEAVWPVYGSYKKSYSQGERRTVIEMQRRARNFNGKSHGRILDSMYFLFI